MNKLDSKLSSELKQKESLFMFAGNTDAAWG